MLSQNLLRLTSLLCIVIIASFCQTSLQKKYLSPEEQSKYIKQGEDIVQQSFQALSAELSKALQEGGVQNAVGYCHLKASPIIDSLSIKYGVKISRLSVKYRNPVNKPDLADMAILDAYRQQLAEGKILPAHLEVTEEDVTYYSPIVIRNPMCLLCHGEPGKTIEQENYDFIKTKYPADLATGYQLGDLRGTWKVVFETNNAN